MLAPTSRSRRVKARRCASHRLELPQLQQRLERALTVVATTMPAVQPSPTWKNYYATHWQDSREKRALRHEELGPSGAETRRFKDALFASDLPPAALDAVSANISLLKSPTVLRLEDGTFYGWEGCHPDQRLLRRLLHPRLELCAGAALPLPRAGTLHARRQLHLQPAARRRDGLPAATAAGQRPRRLPPLRRRPVRRRDEGLSRLEDLRRHRVAAQHCGQPSRNPIDVRLDRRTTKTAGTRTRPACSAGPPAPHAGYGTLRPQRLAHRLLPGRAQGRCGDGGRTR